MPSFGFDLIVMVPAGGVEFAEVGERPRDHNGLEVQIS